MGGPLKYIKKGIEAAKKLRADDIAAAAKKKKEAAELAKQAKKLKDAKDEGIAIGKKLKAKSIKRKVKTAAVAGGAGYLEYKTGAISKGYKKAKDLYDKSKKKDGHKGVPLKSSASKPTPSWRSGNVKKSLASKAKSQKGGSVKSKK
jgi:hypothetical protein